jgi:hypothetical protein
MHGLVVSADSLRGIPSPRPLDCDSCWVAVPRAEVDSIRVFDSDVSEWQFVLTTGFLAAMGYFILLRRYSN